MQSTTNIASQTLSAGHGGSLSTRRMEDLVYQIVTVAAILPVLGSLWVF